MDYSDSPPALRNFSNKEKLLTFLFTLMLIGLPAFPSLMLHAAARPKYVIPAFLLIALVSVCLQFTIRKNKFLALVPAVFFYLPAFTYLWLIFILIAMGSILIPLFILSWCSLMAVFSKLDKTGRYLFAHMLGCVILFYFVHGHIFGFSRYLVGFLFIIYLLLWELVRRNKTVLAHFSPPAIVCLTAATLVYCFAFLRYEALDSSQIEKIIEPKFVRLIQAYSPDSELMRFIGHQHMFATRFGEYIFIGPHNGEKNFFLISDAKPMRRSDIKRINIGERAGDMAAWLPDEPNAMLVGGVGKLYELRREPFRIEQEIPVQSKVINFIRIDPENGFVFASQDNAKNVIRFQLRDLRQVSFTKPVGPWTWFFDVAVDPKNKRFYVCPISFHGVRLLEGDAETLDYTRQAPLNGVLSFLLEIDPDGRQLFIGSYFTGELIVCNLDDLSIKTKIPMGMSIRDLTFDSKRRRLYAVNYYAGKIIVLDADRLTIINSLDVGSITRHAGLSRDGDELIVRSSAGIFSIDLDGIENRENDPSLNIPTTLSITKPIIYHSVRFLLPLFIRLNDSARDHDSEKIIAATSSDSTPG